ncbi:non-ribosomal peptide synthetase [Kutzneria sp. CA-103260]|nr:non-ribosomal peptide synthetase [Kutzneria sp. CA-103260]
MGLCVGRSVELVVGLLGVLKAGGVYLPLDPGLPVGRLGFVLGDAGVGVVVTERGLVGRFGGVGRVLCVDDGSVLAGVPSSRVVSGVRAGNAAYAIYTSGSTGQPKGVTVPHSAIVNHISWITSELWSGEPLRFLQITSPSFDAAGWEFYGPLTTGGTLVMAPPQFSVDSKALRELVVAERIDVLGLPPAVLRQFVADGGLTGTSLRWMVCGGEALDHELVAQCQAQLPGLQVVNLYGPTETTINSTFHLPVGDVSEGMVPIGRPITGTRVYTVDESLELTAEGTPGELLIGGAGVARGYLGRPALTAQRFVPDAFSGIPGQRLYRTGDRVTTGPGGELEFLGRIDDQIKLRGFRIEPGEIESVLGGLPGVTNCAVVRRDDPRAGARLVAYLTGDADIDELRDALRDRLPHYMVPSLLVRLAALPLTVSGKIDRNALPEPGTAVEPRVVEGPRDPVEQALVELVADVLGLRPQDVGVHDDFFDLGGHSMAATKLSSAVRAVLAAELAPVDVLHQRTVAGIADLVRSRGAAGTSAPVVPADRSAGIALSAGQQRMWFLEQLSPGLSTYTVPLAYRLRGELSTEHLRAAVADVVARHEVLRTVLPTVDGRPAPAIQSDVDVPWEVVDATGLSEAEVVDRAEQLVRCSFDLATGPVIRASLLRIGPADHLVVIAMHHMVFDGWSVDVFTRELVHHYESRVSGVEAALPALSLNYADFAAWQQEWLGTEAAEAQARYWQDRLVDAPTVLELPSDRQRPAVQTHRGGVVELTIPGDLAAAVRSLAAREGVTTFMTLLAAFDLLVARHTGQRDFLIGVPVATRGRAELEPLIGFLVNTLALRADLSDDPSVGELLARVRQTCLGAYAHADLPFEKIVETLQPERDPSRSPVVQVMFGYEMAPAPSRPMADVAVELTRLHNGAAICDLMLSLEDDGDGVAGRITYNSDLFDAATVRRLAGHYLTLLESLTTAQPSSRVSGLTMLTTAENAEIADRLSDVDWPEDRCLHELFEAVVDGVGGGAAVVCGGRVVGFAELDEWSNRVAWWLRGCGVGPEVVVGLCVGRSVELVVGLLGVLKAGGVYLPLDPGLPVGRLGFVLGDAGVGVVVTERGLVGRFGGVGRVLCVDDGSVLAGVPSSRVVSGVRAGNAAYAIYTSGSTGQPKGVVMTHRAARRLIWATRSVIVGDGEFPRRIGLNAPVFFDSSVKQLGWLLGGATLVMVPEQARRDPELLLDLIERERLDLLDCTPAQLEMLRAIGKLDRIPHGIRLLIAGEAMGDGLWQEMGDGRWRAFNQYGPTECNTVSAAVVDAARTPVIGRALPGYDIFIVDGDGNLVPTGVPGELVVGGGRLARGYHNRPALTAQRFVPDAFTGRPGRRLYRTGDIARYLPDGNVEFIGRRDNQIKLRGYRIELGEIEAAVSRQAGVTRSVALVHEDSGGTKRIVAYYQAAPDVREQDLLAALADDLPDYMVPAALVRVDTFALTANAKINRAALPAPDFSSAPAAGDFAAPRDPVEELLALLWAEVLDQDRPVGIHDDFFRLGGQSLLAVQLIARVNQAFAVELSVQALYADATPSGTAQALRALAEPELLARRAKIIVAVEGMTDAEAAEALRELTGQSH